MTAPAFIETSQENAARRTADALERVATALEQLTLEFVEWRTNSGVIGVQDSDLPAEPDYVRPLPPDLVSQPASAVVMGPVPYQRPQRPPANPNQQPGLPCPVHGWTWKFVPSGTSKKTGKPYDAFWACNVQGCTQRPA